MSDRIPREHLDRPFDLGDLVHSKGTLTADSHYTAEANEERRKHTSEIGVVKSLHNAHGKSCVVMYADGEAAYHDDELVLFGAYHQAVMGYFKDAVARTVAQNT